MNIKPVQLASFCRNPTPDIKCIILFGANEGLINEWQNKCAVAVCDDINDAFRYQSFEMEQISSAGGELYGEYHAQSLMGGRRVIVVKNADDHIYSIIKNMIPETKSDNLLIVSSLSLNTRSSLISWAKDRDDIYVVGCYDDREDDVVKSATQMLKERELQITPDALQLLVSRLSSDRKMNTSEIDKLALYLGDKKTVEIADVKAAVSDVAGADYDDLCYFVAGGNVAMACAMFERLIKEGKDCATIIRQISFHFLKLLGVSALISEGKTTEEALRTLRPPLMFYRKDDFIRQLRVWNKDRIMSALSMLYECERDCKTTGMPQENIAGYCLLRISGAVKKFR